jgi:hypothetical protein
MLYQILSGSSNQDEEIDGTCSTGGKVKKAYRYTVLVEKHEGKRLMGRPRSRWEGKKKKKKKN